MRARYAILASAVSLLAMACSFGVDLDNLFSDVPPNNGADGSTDGQSPVDAIAPVPDATIPKSKVLEVQAGDDFACGRRVDGTVMCWGYNDSYGQLGTGGPLSSSAPVLVKDLKDAVSLSVGSVHACVAHKTGTVSCWGRNGERQLGDGTTNNIPVPVDVVQLSNVLTVAVGGSFSCALRGDGSVWCWGDDTAGQLGDGVQTTRSQPAAVMGLTGATQLVAASGTACALVKSGDVYCWGANDQGQTGAAGSKMPVLQATKVAGLTGIKSIGAGSQSNHFCAVTGTSTVQCWGDGGSGQLGNSTTTSSGMPVNVVSIDDAVGVTTGGGFSCAWRRSGALNCWGTNSWRQLGVGDTMPPGGTSTPLPVVGLTAVASAATGSSFACAIFNAGDNVSCWGSNFAGSLGRATLINSATPVPVMIGASKGITTGSEHGCALTNAGTVSCWGMNSVRQLGNSTILGSGAPIPVPALTGVTQAAAGSSHTCALLGSQVQCWGLAQYGELGDNNAPYIALPPVVFGATTGLNNATSIGAGNEYTCALLSNQQVVCSGNDSYDDLGHPSGQQNSPVPVITPPVSPDAGPDAGDAGPPVSSPLGGVTRLSTGAYHACALHGGTVSCWGSSNNGESGNTQYSIPYPFDITLPAAATDVACGGAHTCALLMDGSVRCWGANGHGQLGGAGGDGPALRTPNLGGKTAKALALGDNHTCALATDGTVLCWGNGSSGQIGNGVLSDTPTPAAVTGLTAITQISAKSNHACALSMTGAVSCWGNNESAQLGNGTVLSTGTPAPVAGY